MNKAFEIKAGDKFNNWTVINQVPDKNKKGGRCFLCRNSYGKELVIRADRLVNGVQKGYYNKGIHNANYKHGMNGTRIQYIWQGMKSRCNNKNNKAYGRRGITYDPRWEKFENFYEDMKDGYEDDLTIERIDVNGNYCKENCTWIPKYKQSENVTTNVFVEYEGKKYKLFELSRKLGINYNTLYGRIFQYKITDDRLFTIGKIKVRHKKK